MSKAPVRISFLRFGKSFMSTMLVTTPSKVPNWESIPNVNSIKKNSTDQNCAPGNWLIASVKMMNAKPVPDADYATIVIIVTRGRDAFSK